MKQFTAKEAREMDETFAYKFGNIMGRIEKAATKGDRKIKLEDFDQNAYRTMIREKLEELGFVVQEAFSDAEISW
jgi:hypothetical protein